MGLCGPKFDAMVTIAELLTLWEVSEAEEWGNRIFNISLQFQA
jgi:hypothetical protein